MVQSKNNNQSDMKRQGEKMSWVKPKIKYFGEWLVLTFTYIFLGWLIFAISKIEEYNQDKKIEEVNKKKEMSEK